MFFEVRVDGQYRQGVQTDRINPDPSGMAQMNLEDDAAASLPVRMSRRSAHKVLAPASVRRGFLLETFVGPGKTGANDVQSFHQHGERSILAQFQIADIVPLV